MLRKYAGSYPQYIRASVSKWIAINASKEFLREGGKPGMPTKKHWEKHFSLEAPGQYRICVQGRLDADLSDRLAGMHIQTTSEADAGTVSALEGGVRDQAELVGVLNSLYELHLPILSVEILEKERRGKGV